jgi:uncharacterized membrane protein
LTKETNRFYLRFMSTTMIASIKDLVAALGGRSAVATLLEIDPAAVTMWSSRGFIPTGHHLKLYVACRRRGIAIDEAVFDLPPGALDVSTAAEAQVA